MKWFKKPGSFGIEEVELDDTVSTQDEEFIFEPTSSADLAKRYEVITKHIEGSLNNILHPCCQSDVTPSIAFPNSSVTYVDMTKEWMDALREDGYDARWGKVPLGRDDGVSESDLSEAPEFEPDKDYDLLILLNPQIGVDGVVEWVRNKGYVLCNNYHSTADEMYAHGDFEPVAVIPDSDGTIIDTDELDDYFELVTSDDEYRKIDPDDYRIIQRFIYGWRAYFPRVFNVSSAVPQFLEKAHGQHEMFEGIFIGNKSLPKPLRVKWSNVDGLFLFRKATTHS